MTYLKAGYQLMVFHHLRNDLRKDFTKCLEYCNVLPSAFDYIAAQHISHSSTNFQKTISVEETPFVKLR
jgi:hypothetical protein